MSHTERARGETSIIKDVRQLRGTASRTSFPDCQLASVTGHGGVWILLCSFVFFFSSRRRHTRFDCDWSSDVCSSDLIGSEEYAEDNDSFGLTTLMRQHARVDGRRIELRFPAKSGSRAELTLSDPGKIGRASCRERV